VVLTIQALVVAIGPLSIDMVLPAMPVFGRALSADADQLQATMTVYLMGLAIGHLAWGPLSDAFGRRRPLLAGLWLYLFSALGCALTGDIHVLIGLRGLQALGASAAAVIVRAMIRDRHAPSDVARAFSTLTAMMGFAPVVAPLLGGVVLLGAGWRAIFGLLAAWSAALLVLVATGLHETHHPVAGGVRPAALLRGLRRLLGHRRFMLAALSAAATQSILLVYLSAAPLVLGQAPGTAPDTVSWLLALSGAAYIIGAQVNGLLLRIRSAASILRRAARLQLAATASLLLLSVTGRGGLLAQMTAICVLLASIGLSTPNALALALRPFRGRVGMAASLISGLQYLLAIALIGVRSLLGPPSMTTVALVALGVAVAVNLVGVSAARERAGRRAAVARPAA
jgi:DHA1 family bicyclomycin/chloramphenicol resistance-like MFS transporter